METSYLKTLELDKIIARAAEGCVCKEAKAKLLALEPQCDPDEVRYALEQTDAINTLLIKNGSPRFGGVEGVSALAARAVKGGVLSMGELLTRSGCMEATVNWLNSSVIKSPRGAELAIFSLSTVFGILIAAINTIANICVAPFVNAIGRKNNLHPYRSANILATTICSFPFFVPFGGCVLLLLGGDKAYSDGFKQILLGGFYMMPSGIGKEIVTAAPLIMCGLSVAFAFKTGLFNIGAAGQYTLGAFGGLVFALLLHAPWWVCLLASTVFGAIWGAIPGIFKAYLNVNEVITAIMFNWIGLYGCNTIMYGRGTGAMYNAKQSKTFAVTGQSLIPSKLFGWDMTETFGYKSCTIAIFLAILVAILLYVVINKTTFGYELKACGCNKNAAKYAGIDEKRSIILSMIIAGALAGFGAGLYYLSGAAQWIPGDSTALPSEGFDGISVALLASSDPIAAIFSAIFISHISTGGGFMNASLFPPEIADIISGIIIYLCAFSLLFKNLIVTLFTGKHKKAPEPAKTDAKKPDGKEAQ